MRAVLYIFLITVSILFSDISSLAEENPLFDIDTEAELLKEIDWLQQEAVIFSASRREQKLSKVPAAVFVITGEEIRRMGVTNIPDALRTVPGLQVAQINSMAQAISVRGENNRFSNKLLVLIDGRSVYTPVFSGVFWHTKDVMLEDVERIEVIRGPGATMWGANAVNGVINIITKNAKDTSGGIAVAGTGDEEKGFGSVRYGGKIGDNTYYRAYVKYFDRDDFTMSSNEDSNDEWRSFQGGFRIDADLTGRDFFKLQGDIYEGAGGEVQDLPTLTSPYSFRSNVDAGFSGGNILGQWKHAYSDTSEITLQCYYDRTVEQYDFIDSYPTYKQTIETYDLDFQHRFKLNSRQNLTWGIGFRYIDDDINSSPNLIFDPENRETELYSAFIQDEISLIEKRLQLTLGSKFEYNDYSHFEIQPNARLLWTPHERHTLWTSISRAVRTPSRYEHDMSALHSLSLPPDSLFAGSPVALVSMEGDEGFKPEELTAYEAGYRYRHSERLSLDMAVFYNDYHNLQTFETGEPSLTISGSSAYLLIPGFLDNELEGETYGIELSVQWEVFPWWSLLSSYSYLLIERHDKDSNDTDAEAEERTSPRNQFTLKSSMALLENIELDTILRYVDNIAFYDIDSYVEADIRIGWTPAKNLELSLVGKNLLDESHPEYINSTFIAPLVEVERSIYGKVTWKF